MLKVHCIPNSIVVVLVSPSPRATDSGGRLYAAERERLELREEAAVTTTTAVVPRGTRTSHSPCYNTRYMLLLRAYGFGGSGGGLAQHRSEGPSGRGQLVIRAGLRHPAALQHDDVVCMEKGSSAACRLRASTRFAGNAGCSVHTTGFLNDRAVQLSRKRRWLEAPGSGASTQLIGRVESGLRSKMNNEEHQNIRIIYII